MIQLVLLVAVSGSNLNIFHDSPNNERAKKGGFIVRTGRLSMTSPGTRRCRGYSAWVRLLLPKRHQICAQCPLRCASGPSVSANVIAV